VTKHSDELGDQDDNHNEPHNVQEAISFILHLNGAQEELISKAAVALKIDNFQKGMRAFLSSTLPQLEKIMKETNTSIDWVVKRIKTLMQEEVWLWTEEAVEFKLADVQADLSLLFGLNRLVGKTDADLQRAIERFKDEWLPTKTKLPLLLLTIVSSGETKEAIEILSNLLEGQWPETEARLRVGNLLTNRPAAVREAIADQDEAIKAWSKKNLGEELSEEDARHVIEALPILSRETDEFKIRKEIAEICGGLARTKLAQEVRQLWRDLTSSESPLKWGRSHRVPVRWTLEGLKFARLINVVNQSGERAEPELKEALRTMQEKSKDIEKLKDQKWVNQRIVEVLIPHSTDMIEDDEDVKNLKAYLINKLGNKVEHWPYMQTKAREVANSWIQDLYHRKGYEQVTRNIEGLSSSDMRDLLKELAHDPAIGAKLLRKLRNTKE